MVTMPTAGTSEKHQPMVLARVQRIPEGMTRRPRRVLAPNAAGLARTEDKSWLIIKFGTTRGSPAPREVDSRGLGQFNFRLA